MSKAAEEPGAPGATGKEPPRSLRVSEPAAPAAVPTLRRAVAEFAGAHGAGAELLEQIKLAVSEVVTNAVKYGYEPGVKGAVELAASAARGWIRIEVSDRGRGFSPGESGGLGIGLSLVAQMSSDFSIDQSSDGTTVTMLFPLSA